MITLSCLKKVMERTPFLNNARVGTPNQECYAKESKQFMSYQGMVLSDYVDQSKIVIARVGEDEGRNRAKEECRVLQIGR